MKNVANRLIVFAVSALAFGTTAFGQTKRMTAEIPFAFRTATTASGLPPITRHFRNGLRSAKPG